MLKKLACKIAIFMKFQYELYSDDGQRTHYFETLYLSNPLIVTYCQKVSLSQPQFIKHNFLFKKFNFVIRDGRIQLQLQTNVSLTVTKFAFLFQANEFLQCMRHRICLVFQTNKSLVYQPQNLTLSFVTKLSEKS